MSTERSIFDKTGWAPSITREDILKMIDGLRPERVTISREGNRYLIEQQMGHIDGGWITMAQFDTRDLAIAPANANLYPWKMVAKMIALGYPIGRMKQDKGYPITKIAAAIFLQNIKSYLEHPLVSESCRSSNYERDYHDHKASRLCGALSDYLIAEVEIESLTADLGFNGCNETSKCN